MRPRADLADAAVPPMADRGTPSRARALWGRGVRKVSDTAVRFVERRRADRIRRDPSGLVSALRSANTMLIVCQGNIIRSPFTERLVAQELGHDGRTLITSAGLAARPGTPTPPMAAQVAHKLRVDLGNHVSRALTREMVAISDIIFVMDIGQLAAMRRRFPEAHAKTFLITALAPESPREVHDPFDGDASVVRACYEHISEAVRPMVRLLRERGRRQ